MTTLSNFIDMAIISMILSFVIMIIARILDRKKPDDSIEGWTPKHLIYMFLAIAMQVFLAVWLFWILSGKI